MIEVIIPFEYILFPLLYISVGAVFLYVAGHVNEPEYTGNTATMILGWPLMGTILIVLLAVPNVMVWWENYTSYLRNGLRDHPGRQYNNISYRAEYWTLTKEEKEREEYFSRIGLE